MRTARLDSAEPRWLKEALSNRIEGLLIGRLSAGDFWIMEGDKVVLIVERKAVSDLLGSMKKDHTLKGKDTGLAKINRQVEEALAVCNDVVLLFEGEWTVADGFVVTKTGSKRAYISGWHLTSMVGKLRHLQRDYPSLVLLPSANRLTTIDILAGLLKA